MFPPFWWSNCHNLLLLLPGHFLIRCLPPYLKLMLRMWAEDVSCCCLGLVNLIRCLFGRVFLPSGKWNYFVEEREKRLAKVKDSACAIDCHSLVVLFFLICPLSFILFPQLFLLSFFFSPFLLSLSVSVSLSLRLIHHLTFMHILISLASVLDGSIFGGNSTQFSLWPYIHERSWL